MAPTVALRGRVRGLCSKGRRWGKRWYFIPSMRSRWHSTLSRRRGLDSRSAKNCTHGKKRGGLTYQHTGSRENHCYIITTCKYYTKIWMLANSSVGYHVFCSIWGGVSKRLLFYRFRDYIRSHQRLLEPPLLPASLTCTSMYSPIIWHTRTLICFQHLISSLVNTPNLRTHTHAHACTQTTRGCSMKPSIRQTVS